MPDPTMEFFALRDLLEATTHQPAFARLRARRRRRTRAQLAVALVAAGTLFVAVGTALALGGPFRNTVAPATPATELRMLIDLAADPAGELYTLLKVCPLTGTICQDENVRYELYASPDFGATWALRGEPPSANRIRALGDGRLLMVGTELTRPDPTSTNVAGPVAGWSVAMSVDNGRTWRIRPQADARGAVVSAAAEGTAWITAGTTAFTVDGDADPVATPAFPAGITQVHQLVALSPDGAVIVGQDWSAGPARWFATTDRGTGWTELADPCADGPGAGRAGPLSVASDDTWWVACAASGGAARPSLDPNPVPEVPVEIRVSSDHGRTWLVRTTGSEAPATYDGLTAASATTAWRYGLGGAVARTADGPTWTVVDRLPPASTIPAFLAVDGQRAVTYVLTAPADPATEEFGHHLRITRDGGATWSTSPLPGRR